MMGDNFYSDVVQRVIVQALAVIENAKLNILEDEDNETYERIVEFEGISYYPYISYKMPVCLHDWRIGLRTFHR